MLATKRYCAGRGEIKEGKEGEKERKNDLSAESTSQYTHKYENRAGALG